MQTIKEDNLSQKLQRVCEQFHIRGAFQSYEEIKVGNINKTYKVNFIRPDDKNPGKMKDKSYIVQQINTYAFKNPIQVMENIEKVTEYIHAKDPKRIALHFHCTEQHQTYYVDESGFWRLFNYVPSATYSSTDNLRVIRNAGAAFGDFQTMLSDFNASELFETIPDFHNTVKRYEKFEADVTADPVSRVAEVRQEIEWLLSVKDKACRLTRMQEAGELPLRVTHNDTKINNVLFDAQTDEALVVIDLDTVMPGLVGHDFGDAIRFAANFVAEDCPDAEKAGLDLTVFRAFAEGFLEKTAKALTEQELNTLALSSFVLSCELATRFLDDYIMGDVYFKIEYPEHNLVRTRCQIALAKDILRKLPEMEQIIKECMQKI